MVINNGTIIQMKSRMTDGATRARPATVVCCVAMALGSPEFVFVLLSPSAPNEPTGAHYSAIGQSLNTPATTPGFVEAYSPSPKILSPRGRRGPGRGRTSLRSHRNLSGCPHTDGYLM